MWPPSLVSIYFHTLSRVVKISDSFAPLFLSPSSNTFYLKAIYKPIIQSLSRRRECVLKARNVYPRGNPCPIQFLSLWLCIPNYVYIYIERENEGRKYKCNCYCIRIHGINKNSSVVHNQFIKTYLSSSKLSIKDTRIRMKLCYSKCAINFTKN